MCMCVYHLKNLKMEFFLMENSKNLKPKGIPELFKAIEADFSPLIKKVAFPFLMTAQRL